MEHLMKVHEVAARWRLSGMTIYRMIHDGTLPSVRVGRSFRIPESAVLAYEKEHGTARSS